MTNTATIRVDEKGRQIIARWNDWDPTAELRFTIPPFGSAVLQQRWIRGGYNTAGQLADHEYQWRDVPQVFAD